MPENSLMLSLAIAATAIHLAAFTITPTACAQPAPAVTQGGDRGPAILVPTDVTGTQIEVVDAPSTVRIRFEKFPEKFNCKKLLIQEEEGTKRSEISEELDALIGRCTALDTNQRIKTADQLIDLIDDLLPSTILKVAPSKEGT